MSGRATPFGGVTILQWKLIEKLAQEEKEEREPEERKCVWALKGLHLDGAWQRGKEEIEEGGRTHNAVASFGEHSSDALSYSARASCDHGSFIPARRSRNFAEIGHD